MPQPPAAWLLVNNKAIAATYGSYCWHGVISAGCADTIAPQHMQQLATAVLPADVKPIIVVAAPSHREFFASLRPWQRDVIIDPAAVRKLGVDVGREDNVLVFTLEPIGDANNQLLEAHLQFGQGSDASYFWRLTPNR